MADQLILSNASPQGFTYAEDTFYFLKETLTADDVTTNVMFICPPNKSGRVVGGYLLATENGADATDPMSVALDIKIGSTSVFSTLPALDKTAGTGKRHTMAAATGVTLGVIDADEDAFVAGDVITAHFDITITTPDTAYAGVTAILVVRWDAPSSILS